MTTEGAQKVVERSAVDAAEVYRIAVEADADPRTVRRILRGDSVRSRAGKRVVAALERLGIPLASGGAR